MQLRRLIYLLVLATSENLHALLRGNPLPTWVAPPKLTEEYVPSDARGSSNVDKERRELELQVVRAVLLMIFDMNLAMLDRSARLPSVAGAAGTSNDQDCSLLREWEREEMIRWRDAIGGAHHVNHDVSLDSLLDALGIDDGETAGELRMPLSNLVQMAAKSRGTRVPASDSDADRHTKHRFNSLVVRQLLAKYDLDTSSGVQAIIEYMAGCATHEPPNVSFVQRFGTSKEDAQVLTCYFSRNYRDADVDQLVTTICKSPDTSVEQTEVVVLPNFLSDAEISTLFDAAHALSKVPMPRDGSAVDVSAYPHHIKYGNSHVALFLHREGYLQACHPELCHKLRTGMCSQSTMYFSPQIELNFRCIEFHSCKCHPA
jgi:hypothetical protein